MKPALLPVRVFLLFAVCATQPVLSSGLPHAQAVYESESMTSIAATQASDLQGRDEQSAGRAARRGQDRGSTAPECYACVPSVSV
jgi:hypothetical protein